MSSRRRKKLKRKISQVRDKWNKVKKYVESDIAVFKSKAVLP